MQKPQGSEALVMGLSPSHPPSCRRSCPVRAHMGLTPLFPELSGSIGASAIGPPAPPPCGPRVSVDTLTRRGWDIFPVLFSEKGEEKLGQPKLSLKLGLEKISAPGDRPLMNPLVAWEPRGRKWVFLRNGISLKIFYVEGSLTFSLKAGFQDSGCLCSATGSSR